MWTICGWSTVLPQRHTWVPRDAAAEPGTSVVAGAGAPVTTITPSGLLAASATTFSKVGGTRGSGAIQVGRCAGSVAAPAAVVGCGVVRGVAGTLHDRGAGIVVAAAAGSGGMVTITTTFGFGSGVAGSAAAGVCTAGPGPGVAAATVGAAAAVGTGLSVPVVAAGAAVGVTGTGAGTASDAAAAGSAAASCGEDAASAGGADACVAAGVVEMPAPRV